MSLFCDSANIIRRFERLTQVKYDILNISHNLKLFGWVTNVRRFPRQEAMYASTFFNIIVKKNQLTLNRYQQIAELGICGILRFPPVEIACKCFNHESFCLKLDIEEIVYTVTSKWLNTSNLFGKQNWVNASHEFKPKIWISLYNAWRLLFESHSVSEELISLSF